MMFRRKHVMGIGASVLAMVFLMGAGTAAMAHCGHCSTDKTVAAAAVDCGPEPCGAAQCPVKAMDVKAEINAEALKTLMDAGVPMVVVDARGTQDAWIPGAVAIAFNADDQTIRTAIGDSNKLVVTYCGGPGCAMSASLANRLASLGYEHVILYSGGVAKWKQAGYQMATAEMPMDGESAQATEAQSSTEGS